MNIKVRINLSDGSAWGMNLSYAEIHRIVIQKLAADDPFIDVRNDDGLMRSINAWHITSLEEV